MDLSSLYTFSHQMIAKNLIGFILIKIDFYGILSCIHCIIFKKYMKVITEKGKNLIWSTFPRNYDKAYNRLFESYLNIPNCQNIPNLNEWTQTFVELFKHELGSSFAKSSSYLKELNKATLRQFK